MTPFCKEKMCMLIMCMAITTILLTLGKLVQSILSAAFRLPTECGLQRQQLQFITARCPGPQILATGDLSARSLAPIPRRALASLQRKLVHVGDGCACRSPPETETVWGEGVYPGTRIAGCIVGSICPAI